MPGGRVSARRCASPATSSEGLVNRSQRQRDWIAFEPEVVQGKHTLRAISDTGAAFTTGLVIPESEPHWAVVDYWLYPDEDPRNSTFHLSDEPIGFA